MKEKISDSLIFIAWGWQLWRLVTLIIAWISGPEQEKTEHKLQHHAVIGS